MASSHRGPQDDSLSPQSLGVWHGHPDYRDGWRA